MHLGHRSRTVLSCAAATVAAAALSAAPASALSTPAPGCPAVAAVQPFTQWQDTADYFLAPGGNVEAGPAGWRLQGGARAVEGNEPFRVGGPADHRSLELPPGSSATTAPMCINAEDRTMRFFDIGPSVGALTVQALYREPNGTPRTVTLGSVRNGTTWAPSAVLPMRVNELAPQFGGKLQVSLRFTPSGQRPWRIDDVYVDPFRFR